MARVAAVVVSLILLAVWGLLAWDEFNVTNKRLGAPFAANASGFTDYLLGISPQERATDLQAPQQATRFGLLLTVSVAFGLVYVSTKSGSLFSVGFATFLVSTAAFLHFAYGATIVATMVAFLANNPGPDPSFEMYTYFTLLFGAVLLVASVTVLRRLGGMVKGESHSMFAVVKCLVSLLAVVAPLYFVADVSERFHLYVAGGAGLTLASLILIGLTQSNYRYD